MTKVVRGYAEDKDGNLILIGAMPVAHSKDKLSPGNVRTRDIWLDKAQRSVRRKQRVTPAGSVARLSWTSRINNTQQMASEDHHFLRVARVLNGDGTMRMRILIRANGACE